MRLPFLFTACTVAGLSLSAAGAKADSWKFNLENQGNAPVVEFRTQEEGEWSENWIEKRIEPGDKVQLDFETSEGNCAVRTQVRLVDGAYFDADVDYCKAKNLEILVDKLVWKP